MGWDVNESQTKRKGIDSWVLINENQGQKSESPSQARSRKRLRRVSSLGGQHKRISRISILHNNLQNLT